MGAWVDGGVAGGLFWSWVFWITGKSLVSVLDARTDLIVIALYSEILLLWDILFSPYGNEERFIATFFMIVAIRMLRQSRVIGRPTVALRFRNQSGRRSPICAHESQTA